MSEPGRYRHAPDHALAQLAALRCHAVRVPMGTGPSATTLLRRAAHGGATDGLVCLHGAWAGTGGVIAGQPMLVLPDGVAPAEALNVLPRLESEPPPELLGGGWFGWLGYDGPSRLAFYDHLWRVDAQGRWWFEALVSDRRRAVLDQRRRQLAALLNASTPTPRWQAGRFGEASRSRHLRAVESAIELIRAGEIYQVNVCTRLGARFGGDRAAFFADAADAVRPVYAAYVQGADRALAALTPELFLCRRGREVTTSPIKGTWPADDPDGAAALRASTKDAAENVMIVDLMRNDLGRVCEVGSVRPSSLLQVQRHPGVWHLVSTVTGTLPVGTGDGELIAASFPPGSVSGTPKLRAMAATAELEETARGTYTGAVGFVSPCWGAQWAVVIRSFELAGERVELGVGGGVTAGSVPMLEWQECLHKAAPLLKAIKSELAEDVASDVAAASDAQLAGGLLETIACQDGVPLRLADHLSRLERSARELYRLGLPEDAVTRIGQAAATVPLGRARLRVQLDSGGRLQVQARPAGQPPQRSVLRVVRGRIGLWRHKWADRTLIDAFDPGAGAEALFVAADGTVLETTRGNVFLLDPDGALVTPPLRDDLLPGIARRALLDIARAEGRRTRLREFGVEELLVRPAFWTSSGSDAVPIVSVDGTTLPRADAVIAQFARALAAGAAVHAA